MGRTVMKNRNYNKKRLYSALTAKKFMDKEKESVFDNMKHDFSAHLSDLQSDRNDKLRRTTTAIRQSFQSLLNTLPSNIQNLTLGEIYSRGGSLELNDGPNDEKLLYIQIPKSMKTSNNDLSQVMSQKKRNDVLKESNLLKMAAIRNASNKKSEQTATKTRVSTRSSAKTTVKRNVLNDKPYEEIPLLIEKTSKVFTEETKPEEYDKKILKSLSGRQLKPPRKPNPNEEIITLSFSSAGTPLLVDNKTVERINKSD